MARCYTRDKRGQFARTSGGRKRSRAGHGKMTTQHGTAGRIIAQRGGHAVIREGRNRYHVVKSGTLSRGFKSLPIKSRRVQQITSSHRTLKGARASMGDALKTARAWSKIDRRMCKK